MIRYDKYLWYLLRHKWYVFVECCKMGMPIMGILHDWSKFRPSEFIPYAKHFFGPGRSIHTGRNKQGYYKPTNTGDPAFDRAWFWHAKRNKHHWQYWCVPEAGQEAIPQDIPLKYIKEMVCDWHGAAKAQNSQSTVEEWYKANKNKMIMSIRTRETLESFLYNRRCCYE